MKKPIDVNIPITPNFLKVGEVVVDIADFSDEELRMLGSEWTLALILNAQKRRTKD